MAVVETEYRRAFPVSKYPGCYLKVTHITPHVERIKKMYLVFPSTYESTFGGIPALVATVHQIEGSQTALRLSITNMLSGTTTGVSVRTSRTDLKINRGAVDRIVGALRRQMWLVGPADPDHYAE